MLSGCCIDEIIGRDAKRVIQGLLRRAVTVKIIASITLGEHRIFMRRLVACRVIDLHCDYKAIAV